MIKALEIDIHFMKWAITLSGCDIYFKIGIYIKIIPCFDKLQEEVVKALYSVNAFYMNKQKVIFESQLYVKDFTNNQELSYGEVS